MKETKKKEFAGKEHFFKWGSFFYD